MATSLEWQRDAEVTTSVERNVHSQGLGSIGKH